MLEIAVDSAEDGALAAAYADRIELCRDLSRHGFTPARSLIAEARRAMDAVPRRHAPVELVVLVRPGEPLGMTQSEVSATERVIAETIDAGADAVAFGVLDSSFAVDKRACERLVAACRARPAVFHRAFDFVRNRTGAIASLINLGFSRVLTAGCPSFDQSAFPLARRLEAIRETAGEARRRLKVVACGGIRAANAAEFLEAAGEIHSSCRTAHRFDLEEAVRLHSVVNARPS